MARIAGALGTHDAVSGLRDLYLKAGNPRSLRELGMLPHQLEPAINMVISTLPIAHIRAVDAAAVRHIVTRAYEG
jgi:hypothetical protein